MNTIPKIINIPVTSIASEATLYTPTSGKRFRLLQYSLQTSVAGVVILKDNTAGTTIATIGLAVANTQYQGHFGPLAGPFGLIGYLSGAADNVLTGQNISGNLSGWISVIEE